MPLQNRVSPFGEFIAAPARGLFMGNRGGRLHRDDRTLGARRWASPQWICCRLAFKGRRRDVWRSGYTELFFLDEVTALAAGHRPCFECRGEAARRFAECWQWASGTDRPPRAAEMDQRLHAERLEGRAQRRHKRPINDLPDGTLIARDGVAYAVRGTELLRWTPHGYTERALRPRDTVIEMLTPPAIVSVLMAGYAPQWHPSAG